MVRNVFPMFRESFSWCPEAGDAMKQDTLAVTKDLLSRLVAFESLSALPNLDMIDFIRSYLDSFGVTSSISYDESGNRANLYATIGPYGDGGVVLNGHTDVVPVTGQIWTDDPFVLTDRDGRLFGRGSVDMKGFLACMLAMVPEFQAHNMNRPIHISFCFDEEIGGFGAPILVDDILSKGMVPQAVIVGEPTSMQLISGHKAGLELRTEIDGFEAHSSDPTKGVNAVEFAARFMVQILATAQQLAAKPVHGSAFEPPYTTLNIGMINGGAARNITAGSCAFDWEVRPLPGDDAHAILKELTDYADGVLLHEMRRSAPEAAIRTIIEANVPAFHADEQSDAMRLMHELTGLNSSRVVPFGTDAGYFERAGLSTVVFGPGSIDQAHKPDEYIEIDEIKKCLGFMRKLARYQAQ